MLKSITLKNKLLTGLAILFLIAKAQAGTPVWTFEPLSPTNISVSSGSTKTIQYQITNRSLKPHTLRMQPITGITASGCESILQSHKSCILTLQVQGSSLRGDVLGGPVVCEQANPNQCYRPSQKNELSIHLTQQPPPVITYTVTPSGDGHETINPATPVTVNAGTSQQFTVTPNSGYTLSTTVGGTCAQGSWIGNKYTSGAITGNCTVIFSATSFAAAAGPTNVIAIPGNNQVTVSWTAPTNTGGGAITGYTVTYATSDTQDPYTLVGCSVAAPQTSCTVTSGIINGTPYTFAVTTQTLRNGVTQTGYASYSSSVTPRTVTENPSLLALLSDGKTRKITLTNNSNAPASIISKIDFVPALPGTTTSSTTCTLGMILSAGQSCIITIVPGSTVSSDNSSALCTTGVLPAPSIMSIQTRINAVDQPPNSISVVVVDKGCQHQGGYLYSFDDNTPDNTSIGGSVVALTDIISPGVDFHWSPNLTNNSIWGIDDKSTTSTPSPDASSAEPAQLQVNQLNCDGMDDGTCNSHNVMVYPGYGYTNAYAVGICSFFPISDGSVYYVGSYLPSLCEMDSGANGFSNCTPGAASISDLSIPTGLSGNYWSSTEYSLFPKDQAWTISFPILSNSQSPLTKINLPASSPGVRCAHKVTI